MKNMIKTIILSMGITTSVLAGGTSEPVNYKVLVDKFENQNTKDNDTFSWDASAYVGYDLDKIYVYSEGDKTNGSSAESETQLLYSKAISPYWDVQFGVEYDKAAEDSKTWGVISFDGTAPYFIESKDSLLIGSDGNLGLKLSAETELLITQRLFFVPKVEVNIYTKDDEKMEIGKGLSNIKTSLRLKYKITQEIMPYIGVEHNQNYGNTSDFAPLNDTYFVLGVSFWF